MFDLDQYLSDLLSACKTTFGDRLVYVGLQGSHLRGEASATSDIDVMLVLDRLTVPDLDAYRGILKRIGSYERSCGFVCSRDDLLHWTPLEAADLLYATKDLYGTLSELLPKATRTDEINSVKVGLGNLYHALCHRYLHTDRENSINKFRGTCKSLFFLIRSLHHLESGTFLLSKKALSEQVSASDRAMLDLSALPDGYDFDAAFASVIEWCQNAFLRLDRLM